MKCLHLFHKKNCNTMLHLLFMLLLNTLFSFWCFCKTQPRPGIHSDCDLGFAGVIQGEVYPMNWPRSCFINVNTAEISEDFCGRHRCTWYMNALPFQTARNFLDSFGRLNLSHKIQFINSHYYKQSHIICSWINQKRHKSGGWWVANS